MENPSSPSDEKGHAAERGDRAQSGDSGDGEQVEAAGKEDNAREEPEKTEGPAGVQSDREHGEGVEEVIEGGGLPVVGPSRFGEASGQAMGAEGPQGDSQEEEHGGETDSGGGAHAKETKQPCGEPPGKRRNR